jgi:hypothetical protein
MALSGALHGTGLTLVRRPLGPSDPPPVCGVTALINTTIIKQMLHIICNDKTVIYIKTLFPKTIKLFGFSILRFCACP